MSPDGAASTLDPDPDDEPSHRERLAAVTERRLDIPMAVLAAILAGLVSYELIAPTRPTARWGSPATSFVESRQEQATIEDAQQPRDQDER